MSRVRTASLLTFVLGVCAPASAAEPPGESMIRVQTTPPTPGAGPAPASRSVSPETAAKLTAASPKYVTAPPASENKAAPADEPKERENMKPRNTIIRLPEYVVRDPKVAPVKEREILTGKGRLELARRKHPGVKIGNLFGLNNGIALAMLAEEERLEQKREFEELAELTRLTDPANHPKIKREVGQAFMRERDFGR